MKVVISSARQENVDASSTRMLDRVLDIINQKLINESKETLIVYTPVIVSGDFLDFFKNAISYRDARSLIIVTRILDYTTFVELPAEKQLSYMIEEFLLVSDRIKVSVDDREHFSILCAELREHL